MVTACAFQDGFRIAFQRRNVVNQGLQVTGRVLHIKGFSYNSAARLQDRYGAFTL
jgi:hypothetical protein